MSKRRKQKSRAVQAVADAKPAKSGWGVPHGTMKARYDVAQTSTENANHWALADNLSADAAASPTVRATLRNRSRYEVANNSYARGIVNFLGDDTVGSSIRLRMKTGERMMGDKRLFTTDEARVVEGYFADWLAETSQIEKLRTLRMARATDGEGFMVVGSNPRLETPVKLDTYCVEAEMVADPYGYIPDDQHIDGITFDSFGNPVTYRVLRAHPGSMSPKSFEYDDIEWQNVIHYFVSERPGQRRGIPQLTPCLPLFAMLRRYTLATLASAETVANFAAVLQTKSTPEDGAMPAQPFDEVEIRRNAFMTVPDGWEISQLKAEQPTTNYGQFKREIISEVARPLQVPINVALGDSSQHNYSSGRLDWQIWRKARGVERIRIGRVMDRLLSQWRDEAMLIEGYLPQSIRSKFVDWAHDWMFDGDEPIDPEAEANSQGTRLGNLVTTLADECSKAGRDWEEVLAQTAREREAMKAAGLVIVDSVPKNGDPNQKPEPVKASGDTVVERDPHTGAIIGIRHAGQ